MNIYTSEKVLPYVYKLTHKVTGQYYFGSRYAKSLKLPSHLDIIKYQSSSKKIEELGFHNFNIEIIAEFFSGDDAWDFEQQLINENYKDPLILNGHRHSSTGLRFIFRKQSEENKLRLRELWKGRTWARLGQNKGHSYQKGTKNSQFGKQFKFVNNGTTQHKVDVTELNNYLNSGWTLGRLPQVNRCLQYKRKIK